MEKFSPLTRLYIIATILIGGALLWVNLIGLEWAAWPSLIILCSLSSISQILKVEGTTKTSHYNISFLVYSFTLILLGTPAAMLVILVSHLIEWAWHRYPWYIQLFNLGSYAFVMQCAGLLYGLMNPDWIIDDWIGVAAALLAMALFTGLNHLMVGIVLLLARGETFKSSGVFDLFPLVLDFSLLIMGAGLALVWGINPFATLLILPPLYLIYSTLKVPALERKTETDPKTGLYNARYFSDAFDAELARANRFDRPITVIMADLDLLRNINNSYGHLAGDEVLIGIAKILKESMREYDLVARFGGEEFSILVPEAMPMDTYSRVESIRKKIEAADFNVPTSVLPIKVTMSFGIAGREDFTQTAKDIIHNADIALYHAKLTGRNRTSVYNGQEYQGLSPEGNSGGMKADVRFHTQPISNGETQVFPNLVAPNATGVSNFPTHNPIAEQISMAYSPHAAEANATAKETLPVKAGAENRSNLKLKGFITGKAVISLGLLYLLFGYQEPVDWVGLIVFTVIVISAEWLSIEIYVRDTSVSTSTAPMIAGTLLFGAIGAAIMSVAFAAVAMIKHRSPISRFVFNSCNQMIAAQLYLAVIVFSGISFSSWPVHAQIILSLIAGMVTFLSTTVLIAIVIHLDKGAPIRDIWMEMFSWLAPYYAAMGLIAYALVFSYRIEGVIGAIIILIPLFLLRFSQAQYLGRTRSMVKELRGKNSVMENIAREIGGLNDDLFSLLAEAIDFYDPCVKKHSDQVSRYSVLIARQLGLPEKQVEMIRKGAQLHDVGQLGRPDSILNKRSALSADEISRIKLHPVRGAEFLNNFKALRSLLPMVRHHHERFDGKGYPDGLAGQRISLEARIVCVADAIEAMASDRPYRRALTYPEIKEELRRNSGTQFDPMIVQAFFDITKFELKDLILNINPNYVPEAVETAAGIPAFTSERQFI